MATWLTSCGEPIVERQKPGGHGRKGLEVALDLAVLGSDEKQATTVFLCTSSPAHGDAGPASEGSFLQGMKGASWGREGTNHFRPRAHLTTRGDTLHRRARQDQLLYRAYGNQSDAISASWLRPV